MDKEYIDCGPVLRDDGEPSDFTLKFFGFTREQAKMLLEDREDS